VIIGLPSIRAVIVGNQSLFNLMSFMRYFLVAIV